MFCNRLGSVAPLSLAAQLAAQETTLTKIKLRFKDETRHAKKAQQWIRTPEAARQF